MHREETPQSCKRIVVMVSRLLAVLVLLCSVQLPAQHFGFQKFDSRDGLRNLDINCLLQDRSGRLWVCTEFGLYRYNGSKFDLVPTAEDSTSRLIQAIAEDSIGRIWTSTPQKLIFLDGSGAHDVAPSTPDLQIDLRSSLAISPKDPSQLYYISHHVLMVARTFDGSHSWKISGAFSSAEISKLPKLSTIISVYAGPSGGVWLGCGDQICESAHGLIRAWGKAEGVPSDRWVSILEDHHGGLWARGSHHIIHLLAGSSKFIVEDGDLPFSILELRSPCLLEDFQGNMVMNTTVGIAQWHKGSWLQFTKDNGLPNATIQAMLFDREGSLWLDAKSGLNRWIGYGSWENWTTDDHIKSNMIWSIQHSFDDKVWLGTESGIEELKRVPAGFSAEHPLGSPKVRSVQSIAKTEDRHLWLGSDNGALLEYDPSSGQSWLISNERNIYQVFVDRSDRVWVLATNGLSLVDRSSSRRRLVRPLEAIAQKSRFFRAVQDETGIILFASDSGVFKLDGSHWSQLQLPAYYRPGYDEQIALGMDHTFWLSGAMPSLLHFRLNGDTVEILNQVSVPTIASANIYLLASDRRRWLWVGTDSGIDVFNGKEWRHVNQQDGLVWNDIDSGAFLDDSDGSIWIGTSGGLAHLLHPESLFIHRPLELLVTKAQLGTAALGHIGGHALPWGHYSLSLIVGTSDFSRSHATMFRYRLSGLDDTWQETANHEIRYPFVPNGERRLEVVALDAGTNRTSAPYIVDFRIRPPRWRSSLAFCLYALLLVSLIAAAWRWSNRYALSRQHALEVIVQERTQQLEQNNASLLNARAALIEQATRDSLTGILNRGAIYSVLEKEIDRAKRERGSLVVVMADVDHFKRVNDLYGHQGGDLVLKEVTNRLRSVIRSYDSLGRYGGEEFLLVFPKLSREEAFDQLQRLRSVIEAEPVIWQESRISITSSFGAALLQVGKEDPTNLIMAADEALYQAKASGRNRVILAN